jgi:hypothetical protein
MMKRNTVVGIFLILVLMIASNPAGAVDPIPNQAGFSGFVRPGVGYLDIESNMVAEFAGFELSDDPISSLNKSNDGESTGIFLAPFNVGYTFDNLQTQVFLGTQLTDLARFDFTQQLGVKQKVGDYGLLQAGFIFTGIAGEVWEDPYVVNQKRSTTDRDITGIQLAWDKILGSDLELTYTVRSIDIDDERSGVVQLLGVSLTAPQLRLLERDGYQHSIEVLYLFKFEGDHRLAPSFRFLGDDRDGDARANDMYTFKLSYFYMGDPITVIANGAIGRADYDKTNPIYGKKQEDDIFGGGLTVFYTNPWDWSLWGSRPIRFYVEGGYYERDADIDFYDEKVVSATAGLMFRW